jgi:hypothetical protein
VYGDPDKAARKLIEIANSVEPAQDGRNLQRADQLAVSQRTQGQSGRIQGQR